MWLALISIRTAAAGYSARSNGTRRLSVAVLGACLDKGQPKYGASLGPAAIRKCGVFDDIGRLGHRVVDLGDIEASEDTESGPQPQDDAADTRGRVHNAHTIGAFNKQLSSRVTESVSQHNVTITLGGDHSIAIGTIQGHARALHQHEDRQHRSLAVLWIDAHPDINSPLTSVSGNCHGQALSFVLREMTEKSVRPALVAPHFNWCRPVLPAKQLVYIALRDVDVPERRIIETLGVRSYGMSDVDRLGMDKVMEMSLDYLDEATTSLHVSFDIDSLDVAEAPSTGTPVRGGLSLREAQTCLEAVHSSERLRCIDVVEVNPLLGSAEDVSRTVTAARHVLLAALGGGRSVSETRSTAAADRH